MSEELFLDDEGYVDLGGNVLTTAGQSAPLASRLSIPFTVKFAPESDAAFQGILTEISRREAEFRAKRAVEIIGFFNDIKNQSLHNGENDYCKLLADVREFVTSVNEADAGTVNPERCCMYLKNAAITGLTILAEHRPDKHTRFAEGLMLFCQSGYLTYAANRFKGALWGDLFVWASFFEQLMDYPPAGFDIKELNDTEIFINFLLLACLSRVGNGL